MNGFAFQQFQQYLLGSLCTFLTMKSIVFVLFAVALATSLRYENTFSAFEARYGKKYVNAAERVFRAKVFAYNMEWAQKVNAEGHPYTVGASPFADMTNTEFATSGMCGCMLKLTQTKPATPIMDPALDAIDWREKGAVTPVKDQSICGGSWAFSAVGSMESMNFITSGKLVPLSEQQVIDCATKSGGCTGGFIDDAYKYAINKGLCSDEDYPYKARGEDCKDDKCTASIHIKSYEVVPRGDGEALKQAASKAPVSVAVDASSAVFQMYTGGVIDSTACGYIPNHAVLAVGYTDEYWIVKNSWGKKWGEDGYVRIAYQATGGGICGINMAGTYPVF